jgi:oxaloacetate decarboxylase alpha subunit
MPRIQLTDLTLRDAHQSLFATRMLTSDMLPIAGQLDRAGFWSLETWGGATFDTCVRFLNEDPWERLRQLKAAMPHSRQQMLLRGQNLLGYRHYADDVVEAFVEHAARTGVDVFRVFDALNDVRNLRVAMAAVKKAGKHAQAAISYAVTPVHSIDSYVALAVKLAALGADSLCIKDMAGLLKPYEAAALTAAIKRKVDLPLQIHSHATTGLSVATLVKAAEAGAEFLDTTISSMSMGTSHSPTETMVEIFRGTEWDTGLDLGLLNEIAAYFRDVRRKYRAFESAFAGADTRILVSQVPGGMLSNLESQLREQGAADKMDAVLGEIAVVQKDFGYPPLVTPTSQIVGTQAVMNVLFGRYQRLTTESRNLLVGQYGETPVDPNADLVRQALREAKMEKRVEGRPADDLPAEMGRIEKELREKTGKAAVSREDVLTYAMFPPVALKFFETRGSGPTKIEPPAPQAAQAAPAAATGAGRYAVTVDGEEFAVACRESSGKAIYVVDGQSFEIAVAAVAESAAPTPPTAAAGATATPVLAPMPGDVIKLTCAEGAAVAENQTVVIMEALKMQMEIKCAKAGRIRYRVKPGEQVRAKAVLAEVL